MVAWCKLVVANGVNWKTGKCRERYFFEVAFAISCYFGEYFARNFPLLFDSSNLIYFICKSCYTICYTMK